MDALKTIFVSNEFSIDELDKFRGQVIEYTSYGTREISSNSIREFEDEVMTSLTVTEDEYCPDFTMEDKDILVERIGSDTYDRLLTGELDYITIIDEE